MAITKNYFISIFLDTRRKKENGKYPVKLRVFTSSPRIQKLYPADFEFSKEEFKSIWETSKPRREFQDIRLKLQQLENKADDIADKIKPFTFETFEKKLYRKVDDGSDVFYYYTETIQFFEKNEQFGTASNYRCAINSFKSFIQYRSGKLPQYLLFSEITPNWLNQYEQYIIKQDMSLTTVSMYVRTLKTIFNAAITQNEIPNDLYPFRTKENKSGYVVPSVKKVKKALNKKQLSLLFHAQTDNPKWKKARDFFFFSFACCGMNVRDVAKLKYKDFDGNTLRYFREKIKRTKKHDLVETVVFLPESAKQVIDTYGKPNNSEEQLIFSIIDLKDNEKKVKIKVQNFTKFINQHLKKLAKSIGITNYVSTQWARHSWATIASRDGKSLEFIRDGLAHGNIKTTATYVGTIEVEEKEEYAKTLMDF